MNKQEVYFVVSQTEVPERIFFSFREACASGHRYIDSFDLFGNKLNSYAHRSVPDGGKDYVDVADPEENFTTDF